MTLNALYSKYLTNAGLDETLMNDVQRQETRRAFMAGCGLVLNYIATDISKMDEFEAFDVMVALNREASEFFFNELKNFN